VTDVSGQNLTRRPRNWPIQNPVKPDSENQFCTQIREGYRVVSVYWLDSWPLPTADAIKFRASPAHRNPKSRNGLSGRDGDPSSSGTARAFLIRVRTIEVDYSNSGSEVSSEPRIGRSVSLDHAAQMLGVSRRTIYNRIRDGRLQTIRTVGGSQRVLLDSVQGRRGQQAESSPRRHSV
jgi:excisionase family DNA binding protein